MDLGEAGQRKPNLLKEIAKGAKCLLLNMKNGPVEMDWRCFDSPLTTRSYVARLFLVLTLVEGSSLCRVETGQRGVDSIALT
jgi:hypothetical protein